MIAIKITGQKSFMAKLLTTDCFDLFELEEADIETFNTFKIDGRINKDFYKNAGTDQAEIPKGLFSSWSKIRPICFDLIKGKQTPLSFKFILRPNDELKKKIFGDLNLPLSPDQFFPCINIRFAQGEVVIITGMSTSVFSLDKDTEKAWDSFIPGFLESKDINAQIT